MDGHVDLNFSQSRLGRSEANLVQQSGGMLIPTLGDNNSGNEDGLLMRLKIKLPEPRSK